MLWDFFFLSIVYILIKFKKVNNRSINEFLYFFAYNCNILIKGFENVEMFRLFINEVFR